MHMEVRMKVDNKDDAQMIFDGQVIDKIAQLAIYLNLLRNLHVANSPASFHTVTHH